MNLKSQQDSFKLIKLTQQHPRDLRIKNFEMQLVYHQYKQNNIRSSKSPIKFMVIFYIPIIVQILICPYCLNQLHLINFYKIF